MITALKTTHPALTFAIIQGSALASLSSWAGLIEPIGGLVAMVFGIIYGFYHMLIARKKWNDMNKK